MVKGAAEGMGVKAMAEDLGWRMEVEVLTDSSAAKSIASRRGLGKVRHMEVRWLWLQAMVKDGRIRLKKVWGPENVADILTKPRGVVEMAALLRKVGAEVVFQGGGRGR